MQQSELQAMYQELDQVTIKRIERAAQAANMTPEAYALNALRRGLVEKLGDSQSFSESLNVCRCGGVK